MREIKFRQWTGEQFEYWGVNCNGFEFTGPSSGIGFNPGNTTHEQFTEMRDGDGKDIYEFDIVLFNDGEFSFYGVVNFSEYGYVISIDDKNKESLFEFNTPELKVIGNIHQHAYLLGTK